MIVKGSIASLKVALTVLLSATSVAPQTGLVKVTVGGVVSVPGPVVKVHVKLLASALPARSWAPVVTVIVNTVLAARRLVGVKVATFPVPAYATVPGTAVVPGPVRVKVLPVMVRGSIASLKIAATCVLIATPVAPQLGLVEITVGAVVSGARAVVKPHEKLATIALPAKSLTPVVTVTVIRVPAGRVAVGMGVGVKVAVLLAAA